MFTFYEFFAGGGMVRAALGGRWQCLFANDFDQMKATTYCRNWGAEAFICGDVADVDSSQLPCIADLAWASFPCQDLSLAGDYRGLGRANSEVKTRSGTFWLFWRLIEHLARENRAPRLVALENVYGALTSHGGRDFAAIAGVLSATGYRVGALVINARLFLPQSRPRVFFVAVRSDQIIPSKLTVQAPELPWHPKSLVCAYSGMPEATRKNWIWWSMPEPTSRRSVFADLIDKEPCGVDWHTAAETRHILEMMSPLNKKKVAAAMQAKSRVVGGVYRRTRIDENGDRRQRAEVRFDNVAGCLRTPIGGSSRQTILVIDTGQVQSRLLSAREAARLMGLSDGYVLPERYNDAYHVAGDGVCVPVVKYLAQNVLEEILNANGRGELLAA